MKRTRQRKVEKADAILTADLHLTETTPVSRTDDYIEAQAKKLQFLKELSTENDNSPIICAGDVFDRWKASPWLCSFISRNLPSGLFITVPGNHDLPMHSFKYYDKSALSLLEIVLPTSFVVLKNEKVSINSLKNRLEIFGVYYGGTPEFTLSNANIQALSNETPSHRVLILHELIWQNKPPFWASESKTSSEIIKKYKDDFDLIITGDNHESFIVEKDGVLLVNPGSMMRMTADQINFKPKCFLYYAEENKVVPVEFPIDSKVHNFEHINKKKERDKRIAAYIEKLESNFEGGLSFKKNLQVFFDENKISKKVRDVIWEHLETEQI